MARKRKRTSRGRFAAVNREPSTALETQEPPIEMQDVELETRLPQPAVNGCGRAFWPEGEPLPTHYLKKPRQVIPCPECRRVLTEVGGQAVVCVSSGRDVAWFRCKHCGHAWPLPVREV